MSITCLSRAVVKSQLLNEKQPQEGLETGSGRQLAKSKNLTLPPSADTLFTVYLPTLSNLLREFTDL